MPNNGAATVMLKAGRDKPICHRHPWVFSGAIQRIADQAADGEIIDVIDSHGDWIARGYLNRASQIQVQLPARWPADFDNLSAEHNLVIDNGIGLATQRLL